MRGKYERTEATRRLQSEKAQNRPTEPISGRFWAKVAKGTPDECWLWTGACEKAGYGKIYTGRNEKGVSQFMKTHRLSWELANGRSLTSEEKIRHACDTPPCVNPNHLLIGSTADNNRDRADRKRGKEHRQRGENNDNAKLTDEKVLAIIEELKALPRRSQSDIARQFGISQPQISRIEHRVSWSHLWTEPK